MLRRLSCPTQEPKHSGQAAPVATPCRGAAMLGNGVIPEINDPSAQAPKPGELRLSDGAIDARMRRIMKPNINGEFKVSAEIIQQWKCKKKGRKTLSQLFQSVGYDADTRFFNL